MPSSHSFLLQLKSIERTGSNIAFVHEKWHEQRVLLRVCTFDRLQLVSLANVGYPFRAHPDNENWTTLIYSGAVFIPEELCSSVVVLAVPLPWNAKEERSRRPWHRYHKPSIVQDWQQCNTARDARYYTIPPSIYKRSVCIPSRETNAMSLEHTCSYGFYKAGSTVSLRHNFQQVFILPYF